MNHNYRWLFEAGWIIFWVYWLIIATKSKKNLARPSYAGSWARITIVLVILVSLQATRVKGLSYSYLYVHNPVIIIIGTLLFILGLAFAVWARIYLGTNWGTPMAQKVNPELVTSGPYKFVRHPIYSGILTAALGTALAVNLVWLIIMLAGGISFIYSAKKEEQYLLKEFPKDYPSYMKSSKMLIPFIF